MSGDCDGAQYSLCSRGVLVPLHGLEELCDGTSSTIGRGWDRSGSRLGASINEFRVLMCGQYRQQKGANRKYRVRRSCHPEPD